MGISDVIFFLFRMGRLFNPCTEAVQSCTGTGLYRYRAVQVQSCTGTELYRYSTMVVHVLYHSAVYYIHSGIVQEEVCMYTFLVNFQPL